jgi:cytoskeletal protein CcmA (bactofilin family)
MAESPDERRTSAWIGKSLRVEGRIVATEHLTIEGHVEGTIEVGDHSLIILPEATVTADLAAKTVAISGTVIGNVVASDKVDVRATGSVNGDIVTPRLTLEDGAFVSGRIDAGRERDAGV